MSNKLFKIKTNFKAKGDQPKAIKDLTKGIVSGKKHQVLLGVTGSGKTFTMANVIANCEKQTLIIAPNKTLAAQLYSEMSLLFPDNAVEYFVSYYDYYQPEAYLPTSDTYIQKDSSLNETIDKMRHSATRSVLSRDDVIVIASVSCIYGIGAPEDYLALRLSLSIDMKIKRENFFSSLVNIQYERNDIDFHRGTFRARGDTIEVFPTYEDSLAIRFEFFGDTIDEIIEFNPLNGEIKRQLTKTSLYPASHYVTQKQTRKKAIKSVRKELKERLDFFNQESLLLEAQRLSEKTNYDLEMMQEIGYCNGIENYSVHLTGRKRGTHPPTLLEYFSKDFLIFFDESHISVSQIGAMYKGDKSRKETLVKYGFRLPSALDNRPLKFDEFKELTNQIIYVSATPAEYELEKVKNKTIEQIVRPTGLLDPKIEVRGAKFQVDNLFEEIQKKIKKNERVLITTLTKRMAEDLSDYYSELGIKVQYLHSDIKTMERMEIIEDLRTGKFDVLIGINLLREGLDIPEVSLVAILDADKEGFLRSVRSLIQTCGRAARNANGLIIMYGDKITRSMQFAIDETKRRRKIQKSFNKKYGIKPKTIIKDITSVFERFSLKPNSDDYNEISKIEGIYTSKEETKKNLEKKMLDAAEKMQFEKAAKLRDKIKALTMRPLNN